MKYPKKLSFKTFTEFVRGLELGFVKDWDEIIEALEQYREAGEAGATYALADWHLHGRHTIKNTRLGIKYLKEAAQANVPMACYNLGVAYELGNGVKQCEKKAFQWYIKAAILGDHEAWEEIGRMYYHGIGTCKNRKLAWTILDAAKVNIKNLDRTPKQKKEHLAQLYLSSSQHSKK